MELTELLTKFAEGFYSSKVGKREEYVRTFLLSNGVELFETCYQTLSNEGTWITLVSYVETEEQWKNTKKSIYRENDIDVIFSTDDEIRYMKHYRNDESTLERLVRVKANNYDE